METMERIFLSPPWMSGDERERVGEAFDSNYIAPCGPMVDRFEREFAQKAGFPDACALSSGTAALDLLFDRFGIGRGRRVFCSDLTFISSVAPAARRGARPVFIDSDPRGWNMDPAALELALDACRDEGGRPGAVVAADLYGQCCDYDRIEAVCSRAGVPLIIDAAEALGARYWGRSAGLKAAGGRPAGTAGDAAVFSFNGNKIITTSGGGMLASRDGELVRRARFLSQQAREPFPWYEHRTLGYNYRMSNIVAAIGVGQLAHLDEIVAKKREIFGWYREMLGDIPRVSFMPEAAYGRCTRWLTVIQVAPRRGERGGPGKPGPHIRRLWRALEDAGIESRPVWKPMHLQPVFRRAAYFSAKGDLAARFFERGLCLPSGAGLTRDQAGRVCGIIRKQLER